MKTQKQVLRKTFGYPFPKLTASCYLLFLGKLLQTIEILTDSSKVYNVYLCHHHTFNNRNLEFNDHCAGK